MAARTYRPVLMVHLRLLFDESLHVTQHPVPAPVSAAAHARRRAACGGIEPQLDPLILRTGRTDVTFLHNLVPTRASVELASPRQAATFDFTFPFRRLPIDPRTARAVGVEVHLGTVTDADFAAGMRGGTINGVPLSLLETRGENGRAREDTLLMIGTVDEWENEDDEKGCTIKCTGRDMRAILLDSELPIDVLSRVDPTQPVDEVVRQILCLHPFGDQFTVVVNQADWQGRVLPPLGPGFIPRHRRGARGRGATGATSTQKLSYWDAITRVCFFTGAIPTFVGTELRIRPVRSVYDQIEAGFDGTPTPFADGALRSDGETPFAVRRLVWGRNILSMKSTHRLNGKSKPKVVRVIAHDPDTTSRTRTSAVIEARWPPRPTTTAPRSSAQNRVRTHVAPSGQAAHEEMVNIPVAGIRDPAQLEEIARALFEEMSRQELTGTVRTKSLASYAGDNDDPDMLRLKPGDALELLCDTRALASRPPLVNARVDFARTPAEQQIADLTARLGDENLARVIVATARGTVVELQTFFRIATVKYEWDTKTGVEITADFQNYFTHRYDPNAPRTTVPSQVTRRSA